MLDATWNLFYDYTEKGQEQLNNVVVQITSTIITLIATINTDLLLPLLSARQYPQKKTSLAMSLPASSTMPVIYQNMATV